MSKSALDASRSNLFKMDPEKLKVVTDKSHPLYDERVNLPVNEALVESIMAVGVLQNVTVRKNGEDIEVVFGRQRVRAATEANLRLAKLGKPGVKVPVVLRPGEDADQFGALVHENEHRINDNYLVKAQKAQRMINMGSSEGEVACAFGVGFQTIKNLWLPLLDCSRAVQQAVASGALSATDAAKKLAKLPREEQDEALKEIATTPTASVEEVAQRHGKKRTKTHEGVGRTRLRKLLTIIDNDSRKPLGHKERMLLGWINGEVSDDDLCKDLPMLSPIFTFEKMPKGKRSKKEKAEKTEKEAPRVVAAYGSRVVQGPSKKGGRRKAAA